MIKKLSDSLVISVSDKTLAIVNYLTGQLQDEVNFAAVIQAIDMIDSQTIVVFLRDGSINLWNLNQKVCLNTLIIEDTKRYLIKSNYSPHSKLPFVIFTPYHLASYEDKNLQIYDLTTGALIKEIKCESDINTLVKLPAYGLIALGTKNGIEVWDIINETRLNTIKGHFSYWSGVKHLIVLANGYLACIDHINNINIWAFAELRAEPTLTLPSLNK